MAVNKTLIVKVMNQIIQDPSSWKQSAWHCGTSHCFCGWGWYMTYGNTAEIEPMQVWGASHFGISSCLADYMFDSSRSLIDLYYLSKGLVDGTIDSKGYNKDGYFIDGYNKAGFNVEGYDREGRDSEGYSRGGFDREGRNRQGLDKFGRDEYNCFASGYSDYGYDKDGFNRDRIASDGRNNMGQMVPLLIAPVPEVINPLMPPQPILIEGDDQ